ncbi:glycoside hydrolase family 16 protein [Collybia nuda]|uniref:Glycoside hydrolase family 16 protein n=1 Tax=Collybia nuda TaxID=64659 RepID=A0A9P5XU49_9AGAR|nr:glycoside hydrolase family 16 protein [Collybia nuda]
MFWTPSFVLLWLLSSLAHVVSYDLIHDYSGTSFYDGWDFYGNYDNLTLGDVIWLNKDDAFSQGLAYVNTAGNAILKVDNMHDVQYLQKRNSIRITTQAAYAVGSLWITDIAHIPFGCSVWPAFWTKGPTWPDNGEIDIMEAINLMDHNQMALHTTPGCVHTTPPNQMGTSAEVDCSQPSGCVVAETAPNSFGPGFAAAGGGVFATQFDVSGIYIWFWSRPNIPPSITQASSTSPMDVSQWGPPSASYPSTSCDITKFFSPQNLVFDITLCGIWAGLPVEYLPMCGGSGPTSLCYNDNVVGPGDRYNDAFFEIKYVRAYTTGGIVPTPTAAAIAVPRPSSTSSSTITSRPVGTALTPSPLFFPGNAGTRTSTSEAAWCLWFFVPLGTIFGYLW